MRLIFIGPPGSGKGTQAERLAEALVVPHLSTGEMLRRAINDGTEIGKAAEHFVLAGRLAPDDIVIQAVAARLQQPDCRTGCLLDGFPRTLAQAKSLDEILAQHGTPLDAVIELQLGEDLLIERLVRRGRQDDQVDVIRERFAVYERQTAPLSDYYCDRGVLHSVDGSGTPDEVAASVKAEVEQVAAGRKAS